LTATKDTQNASQPSARFAGLRIKTVTGDICGGGHVAE